MSVAVRLAESDSDLSGACKVLRELRSHLTEQQLWAQIKDQQTRGYQVAFAASDGKVLGVAGFVIGKKLAWGKHMYIDDLVTTEDSRSTGVGGQLVEWLKAHAVEQGCKQVHLDSGVHRFPAHRFYLRHGFDIASHHFSITELS